MQFSNYKALLFERWERVLEITLNRPDRLNAVDEVMHEELARVFVDVSNDSESDVCILTGAGRTFFGGWGHPVVRANDRKPDLNRQDRS